MKQYWQKVSNRIDALTLRERVIIFLAAAMLLISAMNVLVLAPMNEEQQLIVKRVQEEQSQITRIRAEIQQKINEQTNDPDLALRGRLQALQQQKADLHQAVAGIQRGLVSPDKMPALLESILASNRQLRLVALKKLPVTNLVEAAGTVEGDTNASSTVGLYRHGVELTVQGGYLEMLNYFNALEGLPSQLLWGDVAFYVDEYPKATMTLTVYTLSLDKQWLHI